MSEVDKSELVGIPSALTVLRRKRVDVGGIKILAHRFAALEVCKAQAFRVHGAGLDFSGLFGCAYRSIP